MNKLTGKIKNILSDNHLSIIEIIVFNDILKTIIIETPGSAEFLTNGNEINILFKETEVSLAKEFSGKISLQNKLECIVEKINKGKLLSDIQLDYKGNRIISIITSAAVEQLDLKNGDKVLALIKTNEIIIAPV